MYQEKQEDILNYFRDCVYSQTIISELEQAVLHEEAKRYEMFVDIEYDELERHYQIEEDINEDDTTRMGKGISSTG